MPIPPAVAEWFASMIGGTAAVDPDETPEPLSANDETPGEPEAPVVAETAAEVETAPEAGEPAAAGEPETPGEPGEPAAPEPGEPASPAAPSPTLPEPASPATDAERDTANELAVTIQLQKERIRDLEDALARLGGDAAMGIPEEEPVVYPEPEDDYDPDADIAEQEASLARLRGDA